MKTLPSNLPRRRMLKLGLGATAGLIATGMGCGESESQTTSTEMAADATCGVTPDQALGPFYPHIKNGDGDVDLTSIQGKEGQAEGEVMLVRGRILDEECKPIENALVEIWQANHHGRYSHEGDANNPHPLDPNFEGWGEMTTDASGSYGFKTIKPAAYSFGDESKPENWRTPHIHFKVSRRGYHELVSQMCFEGEKLNETDIVLGELPVDARAQFILSPTEKENDAPVFLFDLTLKKVATSEERIAALNACAGKYSMDLFSDMPKIEGQVYREGQRLFLGIEGYTSVELKPLGKDEYSVPSIYRRFVFNRNDDGTVNSVTVHNTSKFEKMTPVIAEKTS